MSSGGEDVNDLVACDGAGVDLANGSVKFLR
jgi:hypothetical protein